MTCAAPIFYWGNYSQTLYKMKKDPDVKHRNAHKKELVKIMKTSEKKKLRVPPGVCCEYGYLMYQDGNTGEALKYIDLEETTYPESKTFTQRLKKSITGKKSADNSHDSEEIDGGNPDQSPPLPGE
jgi:hypothetical protein